MFPKIIIHDVFQGSDFTRYQLSKRVRAGTVEELFRSALEPFSDVPLTLAVLAKDISSYPSWVEYIRARPQWRVQCHGYCHTRYDLMVEDRCRNDLRRAKEMIESAWQTKVTEYIPPFNKYNDMTQNVAASLGMKEIRTKRAISSYARNIRRCTQLDVHYWHAKSMNALWMIAKTFQMKPPIIIIGAPRSGTTAYMRHLKATNPDYLALKEHENHWHQQIPLPSYYARQLMRKPQCGIIDKNVRNTFRIKTIHDIYPEAQFVHVIRDGRAAISSWRDWARKTKKKDQSIESAAQQWVEYVRYIMNNRRRLTHYKEITYEELCFRHKHFVSRNFKWPKRLSQDELRLVMKIAGPLLKELGYV